MEVALKLLLLFSLFVKIHLVIDSYNVVLRKVVNNFLNRIRLIEKIENELYKSALESALNRKVDKIYIYSVYLGKELKINNI